MVTATTPVPVRNTLTPPSLSSVPSTSVPSTAPNNAGRVGKPATSAGRA